MLRIYFLQQWFNLSDPQAEDAICDSGALLTEKRLLLQSGTVVDATIIAAPSSTKNAAQGRDPEMRQTKKGNTWYFGMKVHVGTDPRGLVHSLTTTDAAQADLGQLPALVPGAERAVYGDRAYWSAGLRQAFQRRGVRFRGQRRAIPKVPLSPGWQAMNRTRARIRARGEHAFHVVKRLWGFAKVRYRGLAKNTARAFTLFALANLYMVRYRLLPTGVPCRL
jgi:transposase, IS5 family